MALTGNPGLSFAVAAAATCAPRVADPDSTRAAESAHLCTSNVPGSRLAAQAQGQPREAESQKRSGGRGRRHGPQ